MTFRAFTIVLFLAGLFFQAFGQSEVGEVKKSFEEAVQQMILIKNQDDLIPLRRLDTLSIALAGVGLTPGCDLQRDLERYTNVKAQMAPRPNDIVSADEWIHNMSKEFDLVILGISDYESDKAQYLEHGYFIETLSRKMPTILGVFGGQTFSKNLPAAIKNAKAFLQTTHNDYAHSIMAQVIMGGIGTNGKLEETIEIDGADLGRGINTQPIERLRFSPPELVDMDRQILEDSIAAIVKEGIAKQAFPGAQVLVAKDGHVIYYEAFGHHTYDTLQKVTTKDLYDYASLTKITGALPALMQLHGSGKFDLDKTLGDYLPDFKNSNKGDLTFRSMLAHNAQLRPWVPYWQGAIKGNAKYPWKKSWNSGTTNNGKFRRKTMQTDSSSQFPIELTNKLWLHKDFKTKKIYQAIKKSPLNEKPGYVYSGLLFYLLPEMVEKLTNQDFSTYIQKNIYQRIGAYTIGFNPLNRFPKSRIVPTERDTFFRMIQIHGVVHDEGAAMMNGVSSNAGLFSTAIDLAKLMQTYMNNGSYGGEQIFAANSVEEFTRCQYCPENRRGIGFDKPEMEYDPRSSYFARSASEHSFGHSGYTGTFAWADPEHDLLLVFFSNRVYPTRNNRKLYTLNIRPRLHQALYDAMMDNK